jgi:hypothetical protein
MALYDDLRDYLNESELNYDPLQVARGLDKKTGYRDAADRFGLPVPQNEPLQRIAAHESGHYMSYLETGTPVVGYALQSNRGAVSADFPAGQTPQNFIASRAISAVSGAAGEALLLDNGQIRRNGGHLSDILNYTALFHPEVKSYSDLTHDHVNEFYDVAQARTEELQSRRDAASRVATAMFNNPSWVAPNAGGKVAENLSSIGGRVVAPAEAPADLQQATSSYLQSLSPVYDYFSGSTTPVSAP